MDKDVLQQCGASARFSVKAADCHSSPHSDVEDVTAHGAGHGHVTHALTSHNHTGDEVGDGRPCSQNGQTHDLL